MKQQVFFKYLRTTIIMMVVGLSLIQAYAFDPAVNLAIGKTAVARDSRAIDNYGNSPAYATDNNMATQWCAQWDAAGKGSWIYIDLQNYYMVNKVVIAWSTSRWPNGAWYLQVATNAPDASGNSNWVNVYTGNAGTDVVGGLGTYNFNATAGRYVRMLGVAQSNGYGYNIFEMKVYSDCSISQGAAPSIAIFPSSKTLMVSQPYQFPSAILDVNGIPMNVSYTPSWAIQGSPAGATIDVSTGVFRATQTGTYTITCGTTYNSISLNASATVTVNTFDVNQNLALYKPATARDTYSGSVSNVVDGNVTTSWMAAVDGPGNGSWLYVDLQELYVVNKVVINWINNRWPSGAWKLQVATNLPDGSGNSNWVDVYTGNAGTGVVSGIGTYNFTATPGRYVRMLGASQSASWGYNINEMGVYGTGFYNPAAASVFTSILFNNVNVIANEETALSIAPLDQDSNPYLNATITTVVVTQGNASGINLVKRSNVWYATGVTAGTYTLTATGVDNTNGSIIKTGTATLTVAEARRVATINLTTPFAITKYATNKPIDLTVSCVDQYGAAITPTIVWDIQGTAGGSVTNNKYSPANKGIGTVKATSTTSADLVESQALTYDVITNAANIALNKPVTSISGAIGGSYADDANIGSIWEVPDPGSRIYDAWLVIDLQQKYIIELIEIIWEGASSKTFTVDYSDDGVNFATKYNGTNPAVLGTKDNKFYLNPSTARYVRIFSTEAGSIYGTKILDVYIHGVDASAMNHYRSTGSGNWVDLTTWETSTDNINWTPAVVFPTTYANSIEIESTQTITLTDNLSTSDVNIKAGGKLTLNSGKTLTANSLTLNSDANGTATYVDNGTTTVTTANVQQYLPTARNWYVCSPVETKTVPTGSIYFGYQESGDNTDTEGVSGATAFWKPYRVGTSLTKGKGYIAQPSGETTLAFNGTLNTGAMTTDFNNQPTLTRTEGASKPGFNLVGNPYPSYVDWSQATKTNLETSYWYRTKTAPDPETLATNYVFDTYNASGGQHTALGATTVSNLIPPMQAFWVRVAEGQTSGTLTFTNTMRSHADVSGNKLKVPSAVKSEQKVLRLQVSNDTNKDETIIYFDSNASNLFDNFDSYKMTNANAVIPEIYTLAGKEQVVINGLNSISPTEELPLGFTTGQAGTFTIKASEINNFDVDAQIILKDKMLNTEMELTPNSAYNFTSDLSSSANRFNLIFKSGVNISSVNELVNNLNVSVYKNANNQITVNCATEINSASTATIYNALGVKLATKQLSGIVTVIDKKLVSGVYLVTVTACGKSVTKKVILN